jgi:Ca2+-binding RTX toxin-like protein
MKRLTLVVVALMAFLLLPGTAQAVPGDLLGTVTLPGNGACSVAGTFDGTYYMTIQSDVCVSDTLQVYEPPVGGNGAATLVSTKTIVNGGGSPVDISALAWDPGRGMVWGAYADGVWLIDIGDPTVSGDAVATFQFNPGVSGSSLIDGLAYDGGDDTLFHSPDADCNVYHFSLGTGANPPLGSLMNTVVPKNAAGVSDCLVSGVVVGSGNTLYIGRDGAAEIRRVDKTTGAFISQFATTAGRVEDLTCDPVTYQPKEAILAKDAFSGLYEAFEVEPGTCPLPQPVVLELTPETAENAVGASHTVTATLTQGGSPIPAATIEFDVTGANPTSGTAVTNASGMASFTYTGTNAGVDNIVACYDADGDGTCEATDSATKTWGEGCEGAIATIVGTQGDDTLVGTPMRDVIQALGGNDDVASLGGDDLVCAGRGVDDISGGRGDDELLGENGVDDLSGGGGDDSLSGGRGVDELSGNTGDDLLSGNAGVDEVSGGSGDDEVAGNGGNDELAAGSGDDVLTANSGDDELSGNSGDDALSAGSGDDIVSGDSGDDDLDGGDGTDYCEGGAGTDSGANCETSVTIP